MSGITLTDFGNRMVRRGGHDDQDDDGMLILEIAKRAPGLSKEDLERCFVAARTEYGEDALHAIRSGHVQFKEVRAGTRPENAS
jgi:hypothetical protein